MAQCPRRRPLSESWIPPPQPRIPSRPAPEPRRLPPTTAPGGPGMAPCRPPRPSWTTPASAAYSRGPAPTNAKQPLAAERQAYPTLSPHHFGTLCVCVFLFRGTRKASTIKCEIICEQHRDTLRLTNLPKMISEQILKNRAELGDRGGGVPDG